MPEHAALIAILIVDRPICLACIATKLDMNPTSVMGHLEQISKSVNVRRSATERCQQCGRWPVPCRSFAMATPDARSPQPVDLRLRVISRRAAMLGRRNQATAISYTPYAISPQATMPSNHGGD